MIKNIRVFFPLSTLYFSLKWYLKAASLPFD